MTTILAITEWLRDETARPEGGGRIGGALPVSQLPPAARYTSSRFGAGRYPG
jgi:hypothetical protein